MDKKQREDQQKLEKAQKREQEKLRNQQEVEAIRAERLERQKKHE